MTGEAGAAEPPSGLMFKYIKEFFENDWDPSVFDEFWRSPKKLYATQIFVPPIPAARAPEKFGDARRIEPAFFLVHYEGQIAHRTGGRFRFWGMGDMLYVRINGKVVLDGSWYSYLPYHFAGWTADAEEHLKYQLGECHHRVGDWFDLKPGEPVDMEVLIGDPPGGSFYAMLCVQEDGVDYPEREMGGPLLPIFKTAPTPSHLIDEMAYTLPDGQVDFEGGPEFSVY